MIQVSKVITSHRTLKKTASQKRTNEKTKGIEKSESVDILFKAVRQAVGTVVGVNGFQAHFVHIPVDFPIRCFGAGLPQYASFAFYATYVHNFL